MIAQMLHLPSNFYAASQPVLQAMENTETAAELAKFVSDEDDRRFLFVEMRAGEDVNDVANTLSRSGQSLAVYHCAPDLSASQFENHLTMSVAAQCAAELFEARRLFIGAFQTIDWSSESSRSMENLVVEPLFELTEILHPRQPRTMSIVVNSRDRFDSPHNSAIVEYLVRLSNMLPDWVKLVLVHPISPNKVSFNNDFKFLSGVCSQEFSRESEPLWHCADTFARRNDRVSSRQTIARLLRLPHSEEKFAVQYVQEKKYEEQVCQWIRNDNAKRLLWIGVAEEGKRNAVASSIIGCLENRQQLLASYHGSDESMDLKDIVLLLAAQCAEELFEATDLFTSIFEEIDWDNPTSYSFESLMVDPLTQFTEILSPRVPRIMVIMIERAHILESKLLALIQDIVRKLPTWVRLIVVVEYEMLSEISGLYLADLENEFNWDGAQLQHSNGCRDPAIDGPARTAANSDNNDDHVQNYIADLGRPGTNDPFNFNLIARWNENKHYDNHKFDSDVAGTASLDDEAAVTADLDNEAFDSEVAGTAIPDDEAAVTASLKQEQCLDVDARVHDLLETVRNWNESKTHVSENSREDKAVLQLAIVASRDLESAAGIEQYGALSNRRDTSEQCEEPKSALNSTVQSAAVRVDHQSEAVPNSRVRFTILMDTEYSRIFPQEINGKAVVIKFPNDTHHVNNEKQALSYLQGLNNFVQYVDITGETARMLHPRALPLQYYQHGDMFDFAQRLRDSEKLFLPEKFLKFAFKQILESVQHLHSQGIAHRDLTLDNIFIGDSNYHMVLADFGLASLADPSGIIFGDASRCGPTTDLYMDSTNVIATVVQGAVVSETNAPGAETSTKLNAHGEEDDDGDVTVYYSGYLWKSNVAENNACCKGIPSWKIMLCVLCPVFWFAAITVIKTFVNIFEVLVWNFSFPGVLWFWYPISTVSTLLHVIINCFILYHCNADTKKTDPRIASTTAVASEAEAASTRSTTSPADSGKSKSNMQPRKFSTSLGASYFNDKRYWFDLDRIALTVTVDFILVVMCMAAVLMPIILKHDVAIDTTFEQMSANMFDRFAVLALTASNMVLNKLVGSVVRQAVIHNKLYMEDHIFGPDPSKTFRKVFQSLHGEAARSLEHADKPAREGAIKSMTLMDKFVFDKDSKTNTGKLRSYLKMKMLLNLVSVALFAFYATVCHSAGEGSYVFILFIATLSFLNILTSAAAIKTHDSAVNRVFGDELRLSIGASHGFSNVQYYYSVISSLVSLITIAKVAA
jgi:serine/threonine protein kinase